MKKEIQDKVKRISGKADLISSNNILKEWSNTPYFPEYRNILQMGNEIMERKERARGVGLGKDWRDLFAEFRDETEEIKKELTLLLVLQEAIMLDFGKGYPLEEVFSLLPPKTQEIQLPRSGENPGWVSLYLSCTGEVPQNKELIPATEEWFDLYDCIQEFEKRDSSLEAKQRELGKKWDRARKWENKEKIQRKIDKLKKESEAVYDQKLSTEHNLNQSVYRYIFRNYDNPFLRLFVSGKLNLINQEKCEGQLGGYVREIASEFAPLVKEAGANSYLIETAIKSTTSRFCGSGHSLNLVLTTEYSEEKERYVVDREKARKELFEYIDYFVEDYVTPDAVATMYLNYILQYIRDGVYGDTYSYLNVESWSGEDLFKGMDLVAGKKEYIERLSHIAQNLLRPSQRSFEGNFHTLQSFPAFWDVVLSHFMKCLETLEKIKALKIENKNEKYGMGWGKSHPREVNEEKLNQAEDILWSGIGNVYLIPGELEDKHIRQAMLIAENVNQFLERRREQKRQEKEAEYASIIEGIRPIEELHVNIDSFEGNIFPLSGPESRLIGNVRYAFDSQSLVPYYKQKVDRLRHKEDMEAKGEEKTRRTIEGIIEFFFQKVPRLIQTAHLPDSELREFVLVGYCQDVAYFVETRKPYLTVYAPARQVALLKKFTNFEWGITLSEGQSPLVLLRSGPGDAVPVGLVALYGDRPDASWRLPSEYGKELFVKYIKDL